MTQDRKTLQLAIDRSRQARLRAWAALQKLRTVLTQAGYQLKQPAQKSFIEEGKILERAIRKAISEREETLRDLIIAARSVDQSAFKENSNFAQAHQALLKALDKADRFI